MNHQNHKNFNQCGQESQENSLGNNVKIETTGMKADTLNIHGGATINVPGSGQSKKQQNVTFDIGRNVEKYYARWEDLNRIHRNIVNWYWSKSGRTALYILHGLPGIGKTELIRQYCIDYQGSYYKNVIWINAETTESMNESFERLADRIGVELFTKDSHQRNSTDVRDIIYKRLCENSTLVIFDGANNPRLDPEEYFYNFIEFLPQALPRGLLRPYIVITTRQKGLGFGDEIELHDLLKGFEDEDCVQYMWQYGLDCKKQDGIKLNKSLCGLPFAVNFAVDHILRTTGRTQSWKGAISKFIDGFQKRIDESKTGLAFYQLFEHHQLALTFNTIQKDRKLERYRPSTILKSIASIQSTLRNCRQIYRNDMKNPTKTLGTPNANADGVDNSVSAVFLNPQKLNELNNQCKVKILKILNTELNSKLIRIQVVQAILEKDLEKDFSAIQTEVEWENSKLKESEEGKALEKFQTAIQQIVDNPIWSSFEAERIIREAEIISIQGFSIIIKGSPDSKNFITALEKLIAGEKKKLMEKWNLQKIEHVKSSVGEMEQDCTTCIDSMKQRGVIQLQSAEKFTNNLKLTTQAHFAKTLLTVDLSVDNADIESIKKDFEEMLDRVLIEFLEYNKQQLEIIDRSLNESIEKAKIDFRQSASQFISESTVENLFIESLWAKRNKILESVEKSWEEKEKHIFDITILQSYQQKLTKDIQLIFDEIVEFQQNIKISHQIQCKQIVKHSVEEYHDILQVYLSTGKGYLHPREFDEKVKNVFSIVRSNCEEKLVQIGSKNLSSHLQKFDDKVDLENAAFFKSNQSVYQSSKKLTQVTFLNVYKFYSTEMMKALDSCVNLNELEETHRKVSKEARKIVKDEEKIEELEILIDGHFKCYFKLFQMKQDCRLKFIENTKAAVKLECQRKSPDLLVGLSDELFTQVLQSFVQDITNLYQLISQTCFSKEMCSKDRNDDEGVKSSDNDEEINVLLMDAFDKILAQCEIIPTTITLDENE